MLSPLLVGFLGVLGGGIIVAICHATILLFRDDNRPSATNSDDSITTFVVSPRLDVVGASGAAAAAATVEHPMAAVRVNVTMVPTKEDVCAVCLGEFKEAERVRVLRDCSHMFHVSCIDHWLQIHPNCPLCRATAAVLVAVPLPDRGGGSPAVEMNGGREPQVYGNVV